MINGIKRRRQTRQRQIDRRLATAQQQLQTSNDHQKRQTTLTYIFIAYSIDKSGKFDFLGCVCREFKIHRREKFRKSEKN